MSGLTSATLQPLLVRPSLGRHWTAFLDFTHGLPAKRVSNQAACRHNNLLALHPQPHRTHNAQAELQTTHLACMTWAAEVSCRIGDCALHCLQAPLVPYAASPELRGHALLAHLHTSLTLAHCSSCCSSLTRSCCLRR